MKIIKNEHVFLPNHLVLVFKTVFKTAIFRKILDGDPTKIAKMSLLISSQKSICCSTGSASSRCAVRDRFGRRARSVCRGRSYLNDAHKHARTASP